MAMRKVLRKLTNRVRRFFRDFLEFLFDLYDFLVHGTRKFLYDKTLPYTNKYLSRW